MRRTYAGCLLTLILTLNATALKAADITVTVNGKVVAKPCTVTTTNANLELGDIFSKNLMSAGAATPWYSTVLDLSNCPVGTSQVVATFSGTTDSTGYYKNEGTAGNIQLELQDDKNITLNNGAQKLIQVNDSTQSAHFPLQVRALSLHGGATEGTIQAVINVTYTYS